MAVQCNDTGTTCDEAQPSSEVQVTVRRHLSPAISRIGPSPFSPNGDGRRDTATVTYRLETRQAVSWRVTNAGGSTVIPSRSLRLRDAGVHSFVFNGRRKDGSYLPSGRYTVHLDTSKAVTDSKIDGHAMAAVTIDRTLPRTSFVSATPRTVYPARDGYWDSTVIRGRLSERVTSATVQILSGNGRAVRSISLGARRAGRVSVRWNGRRADGRVVAAGRYRYRFVLQDLAGNRAVSRSHALSVSAKKLVKRAGSRTVTAVGSATRVYEGACSDVVSPGVRGWKRSVGYYSDVFNDGSSDCWSASGHDLAATEHTVTLPRAVRYGSMRVDAYGGKALDKYNDVAGLLYYTGKGELTSTGRKLGSAVATHTGRTVGAKFIGSRGKVRWVAATIDLNFYDIRSFTVHYTFYVLR